MAPESSIQELMMDDDIPGLGSLSVVQDDIEATCLVCSDAVLPVNGRWIKASRALCCSGENRTESWAS